MQRSDTGFTVIETLIALMLLAVAAAIVANSLSQGASSMREVREREELVRVARNVIARVGSEIDLREGTFHGRAARSGSQWEVQVTPYQPTTYAARGRGLAQLYWVTATATASARRDGRAAVFTLRTLKGRSPE